MRSINISFSIDILILFFLNVHIRTCFHEAILFLKNIAFFLRKFTKYLSRKNE